MKALSLGRGLGEGGREPFRFPNSAIVTDSFPEFILGWTIAGMNLVLTPALTCFLSPRRGQRGEWFLVGGKLSGKSRRVDFQGDGGQFTFLSLAHWMGEGGRRPGEGMILAGMREVVKSIADSAHDAWR